MIDLKEAERFLTLLDPEATAFTFQTFDDTKKDRKFARILHGTLAEHGNELLELNEKGAGIYVTINETDGKGRTAENVIRVRAAFVDLDGAPLEPVVGWTTKPHIVVQSSPGRWHVYWLVKDLPLDQFRSVQKVLIARFNSDKIIHDLPRVMRLPGFAHRKREPFVSRIEERLNDLPPYDGGRFAAAATTNPVGFDAILSRLGNGPDLDGFNGPLLRSVASLVATSGPDVDRDELKALLRAEIDRAHKDPGRDAEMRRYKGDEYLDDLINGAIEKYGARPTIAYDPTDPKRMAREAEAVLIASGASVYRREEKLVRVIRLDRADVTRVVKRDAGAMILHPVTSTWLTGEFMSVARWTRRAKKEAAVALPRSVAETYVEMAGEWKVPELVGTVETPTLYKRADGSFTLLQTPGYDPASGLLYDPGTVSFPPIGATKEEAQAAMDRFLALLPSFPFVPDVITDDWQPAANEGAKPSRARSVVISAWLTGLMRRPMDAAPLHAIDAVSPGTGKSYLVRVISMILTGRRAATMSWIRNDDEQRKRIMSVLLSGDPIVMFDNATEAIGGNALNIMLSEPIFRERILGKFVAASALTNCLVFVNGNNLEFEADTTRRVVRCRMDARHERPQERQFSSDPLGEARRCRVELVTGGLTILWAYIKANQPLRSSVEHVGSYEDWTLVREAIRWLGQPDPADTMKEITADDPVANEVLQMMDAWEGAYGHCAVKLTDAVDHMRVGSVDRAGYEPASRRLFEAARTALRGRDITEALLGHWFKKHEQQIVGGRRFTRSGNQHTGRIITLLKPNGSGERGALNRGDSL